MSTIVEPTLKRMETHVKNQPLDSNPIKSGGMQHPPTKVIHVAYRQASEDEIQASRNFPLALCRVCAAGEGGYWKITGSSLKIYGKDRNVRYKKSFSFYRGKPGRDEKTDWIMHEYIVQRGSGMV
ncbi:hypothetical protein IFM89_010278, partial [Coptis chinensis]